MNRAFIFPGQGSQSIGMAKDFYDNFIVAKETFQIVDEALKFNLSKLIFGGNIEDLSQTENTQPALMVVSVAIVNTIKQQTGKNITALCSYASGHSLGEYSALCVAESIGLEDTAKLLRLRGSSMQAACKTIQGSMAAIIGMKMEQIEHILTDISKIGVCQIANDNIDGQVVISGKAELVDLAIAKVKDHNYKAIKLNVSAPFHCDLIKPAEAIMAEALKITQIKEPMVPIIANISASITTETEIIEQNLIKQICGRVRWRESMNLLAKLGVIEVVEIGNGRVLTNMAVKGNYPFKSTNISNIKEFDEFAKTI